MSFSFIGLDGEMSGSEIQDGARLIQIGLSTEFGQSFSAFLNPGEMSWSLEAEGVHGISQDRIQGFPTAETVDAIAYDFLLENGANPKRRAGTIPVGWNVGSFDMPFLKLSLPKTFSLFSRRTVDLNALCFALDGKIENGMPVKFDTWKKRSKEYAINTIGHEDAHDAGWDAKMSILCFEYLKGQNNGTDR